MPEDSKQIDYTKVKIKQEKLSPPSESKQKDTDEIINEILPNLFEISKKSIGVRENDDENHGDDDTKEKKSIEPVKSSNEILAELFKVFNADPPQTLLNDDYLLHKKKKPKKEKKRKKKSKKREYSDKDKSDTSDEDSMTSSYRSKKSRKGIKKRKKRKYDYNSEEDKKPKIKVEKEISEKVVKKKNSDNESDFIISDEEDNYSKSPEKDFKSNENSQSAKLDNSRKIIIKSVKDSKIFKEAEDKVKEETSKKQHRHHHHHHHHHRHHQSREKSSSEKNNKDNDDSYRREVKRESSEISLSDEETYLKEKEMNFYKNSDFFDRRSRHYDSSSRSRYRESSRDRGNYRRSWRSRSRSNSRGTSHFRERSHSRSRHRSDELFIDKKRLLEIARKNAISMFKNGSLPGTQGMTQEVKDKVLMRMRYGGKSVEELTEFCRKLSQAENFNGLSDLSSNGDSDHDKYGNDKAFHHPFMLKDRGPIVMNIKNATQIPPKTAEQTKAILMQYPVSSGQQHRLNESEWIPVSPKLPDPPPQTQVQSTKPQTTSGPKNVFEKLLPQHDQQPAFVPTQSVNPEADATISNTVTPKAAEDVAVTVTATPAISFIASTPTPTLVATTPVASITTSIVPAPTLASVSVSVPITLSETYVYPKEPPPPPSFKMSESIFPELNQTIDVSTVIAKRLNAMRKLQENPTDPEALKMMYDAQKNMSAWANSKYTPGQFTGSTGANILSAKELTSGCQAWAKRDQLTSTTPLSSGMGMHLLQKMGWKPGEGLGKTKSGSLQPLLLDVKMDKRGLVALEEDPTISRFKKRRLNNVASAQKVMEQKHPVSLLDEISTKRKWGPPVYDVISDDGPPHRKNFVFNVVVNGVVYQPTIPSRTKKEAKALAAKYCLQQLGVLSV